MIGILEWILKGITSSRIRYFYAKKKSGYKLSAIYSNKAIPIEHAREVSIYQKKSSKNNKPTLRIIRCGRGQ